MQFPPHWFYSFNLTLAFVVYLRLWNEGRCFAFLNTLRNILEDKLPEEHQKDQETHSIYSF